MKKVLLIGPFPKPTTGVSLANKVLHDYLKQRPNFSVDFINTSFSKFDEDLGAFSLTKLFFYLKLNFFSYKIFRSNTVYIAPGQTFFGVLKYALFIGLSKLLRKELIIHVHGNHLGNEYHSLQGFKKKMFKYVLKKTNKGIVLSESLNGNMTPFISKSHIYVLYNFVEDYLFVERNRIEQKIDFSMPKIIFLSNLMEEKGIFDVLEALKTLEAQGFSYEAKIAGNIDQIHKKRTDTYFSQLKNTSYCGVVSGETKKDLLLWGNIFILPTYYAMEGQPISILEAMATGNIVLTTNHAGIPDIFKSEINGLYVAKKDPKSIAAKIKEVMNNEVLVKTAGLQNYLEAKEKYRVQNFIDNAVKIFEA